ncbi:MAG TPA: hypothetical protein VGE01_04980 [Fimbriimonas sp.]
MVALLAGCRGKETASLATWSTPEPAYAPSPQSGNAFDGYALAALEAERDAPKQLVRVGFTPGQKRAAIEQSQSAMRILRDAARKPCTFEYRTLQPFQVPPYQRGWRLLGRVLAWSIQDAVQQGEYDRAIADAVTAHKFGFDLTRGGALDASLGFVVADDARKAIAPALDRLGAGQLGALAEGIRRALDEKPTLDTAFEHEHKNMLAAVQALQDASEKDQWQAIEQGLGPDVRDAIKHVQELSPPERKSFFEGLAKEADTELAFLKKSATLTAAARSKYEFPTEGERPWWRFAKHFFETGRPLLDVNSATMARTRLLILNAQLLKSAKALRALPRNLDAMPPEITLDPYSGRSFVYESAGLDFSVYSVGNNFQDDGGDTDESFTEPDLRLERPG